MLIKKIIGAIACVVTVINIAFAANINSSNNSNNFDINNLSPFYLEFGTGASFSDHAGISADTSIWDATPEGYNASLGTAPLFTAGIGYHVNPWLSFDIAATHSGLYSYEKFQTSNAVNTRNFLGNKTRFFDLSSTAIMLNATLYGGEVYNHLLMHVTSNSTLQPIVGAGIGTSYNTISDFHSVIANSNTVASLMTDHSEYALAYQLMAGMEWQYKRISLDAGYQYFDGGKFETNDYVFGPYAPQTSPAWTGHLRANQVLATLKVAV